MKWFKHISDSLDDPFIFSLMEQFGSDGYVVFFGTLEIYSREFKTESDWKLTVSWNFLHKKLLISSRKLKKILSVIHKWEVVDNGSQVTIFIPKFTELIDEWSRRKLGSHSGVTQEILRHEAEAEADKEEDIIIKETETASPPSDLMGQETAEFVAVKKQIEDVCKRIGQRKEFNPYEASTKALYALNYHPKAILAALISIEKHFKAGVPFTKGAWPYFQSVIKAETPIANARDSEAQCNAFKSDKLIDLVNITFKEVK